MIEILALMDVTLYFVISINILLCPMFYILLLYLLYHHYFTPNVFFLSNIVIFEIHLVLKMNDNNVYFINRVTKD